MAMHIMSNLIFGNWNDFGKEDGREINFRDINFALKKNTCPDPTGLKI